MHRVDTNGAVANLPTVEAVGAVVGYYSYGNPGSGQPATVISRDQLNEIQEELCGIVEEAGLTPTKGDNTQVLDAVLSFLPPIGTIISFYDFDGALTFDADRWKYCDGSTYDFGGAIGEKTLPDLSGRYLVGFGTDGGGDIDSAAWATDLVGAASHQVDLSHTHTGPSHTHTDNSWSIEAGGSPANTGTGDDLHFTTAASGTGATGLAGSATQSIQPRSVRVRYLMRVL